MINKKELLIRNELKNNLGILDKALDTFNYSYKNCKKIGIKDEYSYEELDKFESLTSRFARISDILTQKILKSIFLLLREDAKTFIDRINKAEKLEIIASADELKTIRDLRNEIAHEYCIDNISEIFENVLNCSGGLLKIIDSVKRYIVFKQLTLVNETEVPRKSPGKK
jgi:hypothetical protein